jgi:hypothetical protein
MVHRSPRSSRLFIASRRATVVLAAIWLGAISLAARVCRIEVRLGDHVRPIAITYDRSVWSSLSWAVGEPDLTPTKPGDPLTIRVTSAEPQPVTLILDVYPVQ